MTEDNKILVFTRLPAEGFDDFMGNPEAVIATVEDMGFEQEDLLNSISANGADPSHLLQLMEGRWSGQEMNFAFEGYWPVLLEKFPGSGTLRMITDEGRHSQIFTDYGEIRVLSQDQVRRASRELEKMELANLDREVEADMMLEDLFPALIVFFKHASDADEFVLVSYI